MKIITTYPVEIQTKDFSTHSQQGNLDTSYGSKDYPAPDGLGYSSLDGSSSSDSIRTFQVWANMYHQAQLAPDGKYGPMTKAAYSKWGAEWEKTQPVKQTVKPATQATVAETTGGNIITPVDNKKKSLLDKFRSLPNGAKVGIYVAAIGLLAFTIGKLIKKKK